jgi:hypothetical protein
MPFMLHEMKSNGMEKLKAAYGREIRALVVKTDEEQMELEEAFEKKRELEWHKRESTLTLFGRQDDQGYTWGSSERLDGWEREEMGRSENNILKHGCTLDCTWKIMKGEQKLVQVSRLA